VHFFEDLTEIISLITVVNPFSENAIADKIEKNSELLSDNP
jgi:hypothetical protein